jgi:hypothetical protein
MGTGSAINLDAFKKLLFELSYDNIIDLEKS